MTAANPSRILAVIRLLGVVLAASVIGVAVAAAVMVLRLADAERTQGRAHARAFIAKVRACRHARPQPTWDECELRVQDAE